MARSAQWEEADEEKKKRKKMQINHQELDLCLPEKHPEKNPLQKKKKTCDEIHTAGNEAREGEKKGVGEEVGVNNRYCKSSEETANDPRGEMESAGPRHSQQFTNITALQRAGWL